MGPAGRGVGLEDVKPCKCVGKISRPNVVGKFGVFYHKKTKCKIPSISSPAEIELLPAMTAFKEVI